MTTTECIFLAAGFIFCVLMLADMGLVQQFPDKNVDDICRSVLKKHRETVTLMGFTPTHLSLAIGMLNGVFKER